MNERLAVEKLRKYFPVTENYIFFNNAAESPMNLLYRESIDHFFDTACKAPHKKPGNRDDVREKLSELLGGSPFDYALITSTGIGSSITAAGIDWQPGDNVVVPEREHANNLFPWLALKEKGVEVRLVPVEEDGYIGLDEFDKRIDRRTRVVTIAAVRFNSGFRVNLKKLSELAHASGSLFVVDGIQAAGIVPLNVVEMGIDVLYSAGFKWLLGVPGTGFMYVNSKARGVIKPLLPGMFAIEHADERLKFYGDSRQYETGSIAYSLFYAWEIALDFLIDIGVDNLYRRVLKITDEMIRGFSGRDIHILSPVKNRDERSAILFIDLGSEAKNIALQDALETRHIIIAIRGGLCRISPSFYNTLDEVKVFFEVLDEIHK